MRCVQQKSIFCVIIRKERLVGRTRQSSFWYDTDYRFLLCTVKQFDGAPPAVIVDVLPKEGLVRPHLPILLYVPMTKIKDLQKCVFVVFAAHIS